MSRPNGSNRIPHPAPARRLWLQLGALMCIVALGLISPRSSEARLEPYYVVNGLSCGQIKPRILCVLDTSGSMSRRARSSGGVCQWDSCETATNSARSRIDAAREAIHTIVEDVGDGANFGFMTFDQLAPPSSNGSVPSTCSGDRFRKIWDGYDLSTSTM